MDKIKTKSILCNKEFYLNYENSIITKLFYSTIISINVCKCKNILYSFHKIIHIPLIIPENRTNLNIYDLLDLYFS